MIAAIAICGAAAILAPHLLARLTIAPGPAAALWGLTLALRAATVAAGAALVLTWFPSTAAFNALSHWCWHQVLPQTDAHLAVNGHIIGDLATTAPAVAVLGAVLWALASVGRAARRVRGALRRLAIGAGPSGSVLLAGRQIIIAAAGLRRPQLVVSAGALTDLDDEELAASLEHERGHIARGHRYILAIALGLRAIAAPLPGTTRCYRELAFHLERDADAYAVRRSHQPAALASAICKAATGGSLPAPAALALTGNQSTVRRVRELLQGATNYDRRQPTRGEWLAVAAMSAALGSAVIAAPVLALSAPAAQIRVHNCD